MTWLIVLGVLQLMVLLAIFNVVDDIKKGRK